MADATEIAGGYDVDSYKPAKKFGGAKEGYVFNMGSEGLGYYKDTGLVLSKKKALSGKEKHAERAQKRRRLEEGTAAVKRQMEAAAAAAAAGPVAAFVTEDNRKGPTGR
jgi:hypothetical protein